MRLRNVSAVPSTGSNTGKLPFFLKVLSESPSPFAAPFEREKGPCVAFYTREMKLAVTTMQSRWSWDSGPRVLSARMLFLRQGPPSH